MSRAGLLRFATAGLAGAAIAALLSVAPPDLAVGLAVLAVLVAPVAFALGMHSHDPECRALAVAFVAAVVVRAGVGVTVAYAASPGFFALDDSFYGQVGWQMAQAWAGQGATPAEIHGARGYYVWNALLFHVLGHAPLAPVLANAAFGAFAVLLAWSLAREVAGPTAARAAAWLTALWPSLVLWSSLNLKDALAILAILSVLRGAQRLQVGVAPGGVLFVAAGFALLAQLRGYLVLVTAVAVALAFLLPKLRAAPLATGALLLGAALVLPSVGPVQDLALDNHLETLDHTRSQMATGDSAYLEDADVSTPTSALRFLPLGLVYFLLAPAPWQVWNARQMLTMPEMIAWYALLPIIVLGIIGAVRERFVASLPLLSFVLLTTLSYALVEGNLGTAYRHRAQVLVALLVFAGVGLARRLGAASSSPAASAPLGPWEPGRAVS